MPRSRTSTAWLVLWGGLVFLSFQRIAPVEQALDVVLAPLGLVAELGWPCSLLRLRTVAAAERELARTAEVEAAEGAAALAVLAQRANPIDPELRARRRFVPAAVIERPNRDECWVALRDVAGVARGAPVVCGEAFVGRVVEVRTGDAARARVQLVTESTFRVGAEVRGGSGEGARDAAPDVAHDAAHDDEPIYLTVGGVRAARARVGPRAVRLAVHQPSANTLASGLARVHELFADADDFASLAEGFRLGEVRREGERGEPWIEPELDFLDGLLQVAIVVPATSSEAPPALSEPALADGQWLATRALTFGDPSPWRSTLKIPLGHAAGVRLGAAVTGAGARLLGRVSRAGSSTSDIELLSDPGFTCVAIACLAGESEPRILGRIATLGRGPQGTIRLRWWVRQPLELGANSTREAGLRARLFSGSGEPGLPGGLVLGTTLLPLSARAGEERELHLDPGLDPADVRALFVRREAGGEAP